MDKTKIKEKLFELQDEKYQAFSKKLLPGIDNIIGVRLPEIKKLAKQIAKEDYKTYLESTDNEYFEETMLEGMVIGNIKKVEIDEILAYMNNFIPKINNWSVCDSFCTTLKITNKNQDKMLDFINEYLKSDKEFELRFAVVMLMIYYIDDNHIDLVLNKLDNIKSDKYYVQMAVAWAISVCYVKYEEETLNYLHNNNLDKFTYNKSLQKICESNRVEGHKKEMIKTLKIK